MIGALSPMANFASLPIRATASRPEQGPPAEASPEVEWLRSKVPGGKPEELLGLYQLGRKLFSEDQPQRDQMLAESLQRLHERIDQPKGFMADVPRNERVHIYERLVEACPPKPEWVLDHSDVFRPLEHLHKLANLSEESVQGFQVGPSGNYTFVQKPSGQPISLTRAVDEYCEQLDRITHARGRKSAAQDWSDDHSAWSAVNLEHNALGNDPEQVATFRELLSFYQCPWASMAVLQTSQGVAEQRRAEYFQELEQRMVTRRDEKGWPQSHLEANAEGGFVHHVSRWVALAVTARREGESLAASEQDLEAAARSMDRDLRRWYPLETLAAAVTIRTPEESTTSALGRFQSAYQLLQEQPGMSASTAFDMARQIGSQNPGFLDDLAECSAYLRSLGLPREHTAAALEHALQADKQGRSPLEALRGYLKGFELTGELDGLDKVRQQIEEGVQTGRLQGSSEELMSRFLWRLEQLQLLTSDRRGSTQQALSELFEGHTAGLQVGQVGQSFVLGGTRLKLKSR
ncbi:MAG: hypothetical protein AMXMBFR33_35210 [Candidatus Xenobia bacterium]